LRAANQPLPFDHESCTLLKVGYFDYFGSRFNPPCSEKFQQIIAGAAGVAKMAETNR
jgi:carbonic anhydrase